MAWVRFDHTVKYGDELKLPFEKFEVNDADVEALKKDGAQVIKVAKPSTTVEDDDEINFLSKPRRKRTK